MKRTKGFTLIELLAVIVILAIIALIATPIILNMINTARKSAAKSAALGYVDAVEYNIGLGDLNSDVAYNEKFDGMVLTVPRKQFEDTVTTGKQLGIPGIYDGVWSVAKLDEMKLKVKGQAPKSGYLIIKKRKVAGANLCMGEYFVQYTGKDAETRRKCSGDEKSGNMDSSYRYSYRAEDGTTTSEDENAYQYEPKTAPADPSASEAAPADPSASE